MRKVAHSRRLLLKGAVAGVAVQLGIPLLGSMLNNAGTALAQGEALPKRFILWFYGNGVLLPRWVPQTDGVAWQLSEQLMPFAPVKDYLNVVTGMDVTFPSGEEHHTGGIALRTGMDVVDITTSANTTAASTVKGPSLDQIAAGVLGTTRFKSLEVGVLRADTIAEGDGILYASHNGSSSPNPPELDPAQVFNRVFGPGFAAPSDGNAGAAAPVDLTISFRRSVLDAVLADLDSLKPRLGADDLVRIEQHATSIREIEKRLAPAGGYVGPACRQPSTPASYGEVSGVEAYTAVNQLMSDLVVTALACDQTRAINFQYSGVGNVNAYEAITGTTKGHHFLTHDNDEASVNKVMIFIMQQFAYLLQALKATPEGSGNLLDQTAAVALTEVSEGWSHSIKGMPILIAGRAGGALRYPGVHHRSSTGEMASIPLLSTLRSVGVPMASFGEGPMQTSEGLSAIEAS